MQKTRIQSARFFNDVLALLLHIICVVVLSVLWNQETILKPIALGFFLTQEVVAVIFHCFYLIKYKFSKGLVVLQGIDQGVWWNKYKWIEYGLSATAGTIGTFFAGVEPKSPDKESYALVVVLLALGFAQQQIGYVIDHPTGLAFETESKKDPSITTKFILFCIAFIFQVIENAIVISQHPPNFILPIYIVMWALFGIHAGFRLVAMYSPAPSYFLSPWTRLAWTELVYSYLGWTAKIAVIAVAAPDAITRLSSSEINGMYGVMAALFLLTFAGLVYIHQILHPRRPEAPISNSSEKLVPPDSRATTLAQTML